MTFSTDVRWRAASLRHAYGLDILLISGILGPKPRTIKRWYQLFLDTGMVEESDPPRRSARWPENVIERVKQYVKEHPTVYLEKLQVFLATAEFPALSNISLSTICRVLNFDLNLSRKVLTQSARECVPEEVCIV